MEDESLKPAAKNLDQIQERFKDKLTDAQQFYAIQSDTEEIRKTT